ncbi:MAG: hypothetical protein WBW14_17545 [Candidatus Acidiferrum sp.]
MAELLKNAQGTLRGERDFTPEDIGQLRETMDAMAPDRGPIFLAATPPAGTWRTSRPLQITLE